MPNVLQCLFDGLKRETGNTCSINMENMFLEQGKWAYIPGVNITVGFTSGHRELIICPIDSNGESLVFDSLFCISEYM